MKRAMVPDSLPDELLEGWLGRFGAINGCGGGRIAIAALRNELGLTPGAVASEIVAAGLGISPHEAQQRLTTIPAVRPFIDARKAGQDDRVPGRAAIGSPATQRPKTSALACQRCAEQDLTAGALSYWRRAHHLPGVDWCPVHGDALLRFDPVAFELPPAEAIRHLSGKACPCPAAPARSSTLGRYTSLLVRWLERRSPYDSAAVNQVVQDGCRNHGLRIAQVGQRPVLSDLVRQQAPSEWLALYWPKVLTKEPGAYLGHLDGVGKDRHVAYPGAAGALALAVLFSNVDDIMGRLNKAQTTVASNRKTGAASMSAARKAFMAGESLRKVCNAHRITIVQFESWLRDAAKQWSDANAPIELAP